MAGGRPMAVAETRWRYAAAGEDVTSVSPRYCVCVSVLTFMIGVGEQNTFEAETGGRRRRLEAEARRGEAGGVLEGRRQRPRPEADAEAWAEVGEPEGRDVRRLKGERQDEATCKRDDLSPSGCSRTSSSSSLRPPRASSNDPNLNWAMRMPLSRKSTWKHILRIEMKKENQMKRKMGFREKRLKEGPRHGNTF
ncbi:ribosome-binding factor A [Striga asiatica]|uniref:Ribosome-binding factor A n=1 Tax=Striga asiatica TaxID=4170 RepID=A0A5A7PFL5_STRAF|nr:ribosome-binding factor A [Striga asiatica]